MSRRRILLLCRRDANIPNRYIMDIYQMKVSSLHFWRQSRPHIREEHIKTKIDNIIAQSGTTILYYCIIFIVRLKSKLLA